jgi:hypothetical protein
VKAPADDRLQARNDLAWAISIGGIGIVLFAALLLFTWTFAATLFLIFAGMLLGVAFNTMSNLLGRAAKLPHALRLAIVCLALAALLSGVVVLGGATIAQQASELSNTIKLQLVNVKSFLEKNGVDTSYLDFTKEPASAVDAPAAGPAATHNLPAPARWPRAAARSSARPSRLLRHRRRRRLLHRCSRPAFAAQPGIYRDGLRSWCRQGIGHAPPSSSTASAIRWNAG